MSRTTWLLSTVGKRTYIAEYLRQADQHIHLVGTGNTPFTPAFTLCDESVLMPDIADAAYPAALLVAVENKRINAILSFSDPDVSALARLRGQLSAAGVSCFFPNEEKARIGYDKWETWLWACRNRVSAPRTFLSASEALREVGLPLVRKPRFGSGSAGVAIIAEEHELTLGRNDSTEYIYQELITGEEVNVELCGDLDGRPISICCWKKLLSRHGETELAITVRRDDLIDYGLSLAELLPIPGPCDIDVIDRGGQLFLIEFNMRFGGGYPVSHLAGARFPELLLAVQRGESPKLHTGFAGDIFMMKRLAPFGGPVSAMREMFREAASYRS